MADEDDAVGVPVDPGESARAFNNQIQGSQLLHGGIADAAPFLVLVAGLLSSALSRSSSLDAASAGRLLACAGSNPRKHSPLSMWTGRSALDRSARPTTPVVAARAEWRWLESTDVSCRFH